MNDGLKWFFDKELLIKDSTAERLAHNYMKKARNNIITMELLAKAADFKKALELPEDYESGEWTVIAAYYAMYMSASSVLAKIGYRSKNHTATIKALEEFFVRKNLLEHKYVKALEKIKLRQEDIHKLDKTKEEREIAQYSVTKKITKNIAEESKKDAHGFVNRMEELLDALE